MVLDDGTLRSVIIELLRKDRPQFGGGDPFRVEHLFREVAEVAQAIGLEVQPGMNAWNLSHGIPELHPNLRAPIWRIVWDLIVEGVIRPGKGTSDPFELPYIHVTEHGKTAIAGSITPYDPAGYLNDLKARIPAWRRPATRLPAASPTPSHRVPRAAPRRRRGASRMSRVPAACKK
jgi:hypothetical protein